MTLEKRAMRLDPGLEQLTERLAIVCAPCVLATVISAAGSTYRKPGARMLIEADGRITGLLSGGCLEQDMREHAIPILSSGVARTVTYDMRADNDLIFGIGAGCEGCIAILLEPVECDGRAARAIGSASSASRSATAAALVTIHEGSTAQLGTYLWRSTEQTLLGEPLATTCAQICSGASPREFRWVENGALCAAWIQPILPLPRLIICGAGPDAEPLAANFRALNFPVTVTDHRPAYVNSDHFPGVELTLGTATSLGERIDLTHFFAAIVMSHHLASDIDYLRCLATTHIPYIGVLGPKTRRARLLAELGPTAVALGGRLRGPVGLDIGAVTPEAIALAIAAEIYSIAAGRDAKSSAPT